MKGGRRMYSPLAASRSHSIMNLTTISKMFLGYNTNGFAHHDLFDAVEILAELGYRGVAITIDHGVLSPMDDRHQEQIEQLARAVGKIRDAVGHRDRRAVSARSAAEARADADFRRSASCESNSTSTPFNVPRLLGSDCVSIWSGAIRDGIAAEEAFERLAARLPEILDFAAEKNVPLAFEPEPGMLIDSTAAFERLAERIDHPYLHLTLDIGHLAMPGRNADRRGDSPLRAAACERASRRHAAGRPRAFDVRRGGNRLPARVAGARRVGLY